MPIPAAPSFAHFSKPFILLFMKKLFLLLVFVGSAFLTNAQIINKEKLDSVFSLLEAKQQTMGTIHILKNGKPLYSKSIGYSSVEDNKRADSNTRYRVGSITKVFTATLIFQLIEEGKISLNTPLKDFFPEIPNAAKVTIGNLLNHSSGLYSVTDSKDFNPYQEKTPQEMLATIAGFKPVFEPDSKSEYSNTNYILLGYILEQVEGKPYSAILKKRIADKLDLKDTYYGGPIGNKKNEAQSYEFTDTWELSNATNMSLPHGAGAVVSTPKDLAIFIHALFHGKLLPEESVAKMTNQKHGMGFGLSRIEDNNKVLYGHDGAIDGFRSFLIYVPEDQLAIALTANGTRYPALAILKSALMASYNKPFPMPTFEEIEVCSEELEKYTGVYASPDAPMTLTFTHKDGKLLGAPTGQAPTVLKAVKEHQFKLEQAGITLDFIPEENSLNFSQGGNKLRFKKKE